MLQGRSRIDSSGSAAGSETESGVLEPPSTPSAASVASIQAASKLYSTSLADRFNLKGELCTPPVLCRSTWLTIVGARTSAACEFMRKQDTRTAEDMP